MGLEKFVYVYDFGDSWVHDITVENIDQDDELDYPICLAGKGACPLEDCGGPWGYEELKEEMDMDEINKQLAGAEKMVCDGKSIRRNQ